MKNLLAIVRDFFYLGESKKEDSKCDSDLLRIKLGVDREMSYKYALRGQGAVKGHYELRLR